MLRNSVHGRHHAQHDARVRKTCRAVVEINLSSYLCCIIPASLLLQLRDVVVRVTIINVLKKVYSVEICVDQFQLPTADQDRRSHSERGCFLGSPGAPCSRTLLIPHTSYIAHEMLSCRGWLYLNLRSI